MVWKLLGPIFPFCDASQLSAGHYLLPLVPATWPAMGTHRWRRMGPDGVVEWQMDAKRWFGHCMKGTKFPKISKHDHMLTERSLEVGNLVCTVVSAGLRQRVVQESGMRAAAERLHYQSRSLPWIQSERPSARKEGGDEW